MANRPRSLSMGDAMRLSAFTRMRPHRPDQLPDPNKAAIDAFLAGLPHLTEKDLARLGQSDATCPVCITSLLAIVAEEEMALAMDSPAHAPPEELGVTRLDGCGHIFCRKDILNWLAQGRNTCPACRHTLIANLPDAPAAPYDFAAEFPQLALDSTRAALPLTPEQASSFHSAIMLLSQGDDGRFVLPPLPEPAHDPDDARREEEALRRLAENERREFAGMYS